MYVKNLKLKRNICVGLFIAIIICLYSIVGMASVEKNVPSNVK